MEELTLARAKVIARSISEYTGKPDFESLVRHTKADRGDVASVMEFLQEIQPTMMIEEAGELLSDKVATFMASPINLAHELQYNYGVARALLEQIMQRGKAIPDSEEIRKTLREISRFSESMLKMQERVFNIQQIQQFQERVLQALEDYPEVATRLLELDL